MVLSVNRPLFWMAIRNEVVWSRDRFMRVIKNWVKMSYQAQVSGRRGFARVINRRDIHRAISRDEDAQIPWDEHDEHDQRCA